MCMEIVTSSKAKSGNGRALMTSSSQIRTDWSSQRWEAGSSCVYKAILSPNGKSRIRSAFKTPYIPRCIIACVSMLFFSDTP